MADLRSKTADYLEINKASWNKRVEHHLGSEFYDLESFRNGKSSLDPISLDTLGDIKGKSVLHLQCHFGQDTLSMARMGASCVGIDLSDQAIAAGRQLNKELELDVTFHERDVYSVKNTVDGEFDIVYSTYGTIGWLPDLDRWADVVRAKLKTGGRLILIEFHPLVWIYDEHLKDIKYSYFNERAIIEEMSGTYAEKGAAIRSEEISWNHPISEVLNAVVKAGLSVERFNEYNFSPYSIFGEMQKIEDWKYVSAAHGELIPYVYALECRLK